MKGLRLDARSASRQQVERLFLVTLEVQQRGQVLQRRGRLQVDLERGAVGELGVLEVARAPQRDAEVDPRPGVPGIDRHRRAQPVERLRVPSRAQLLGAAVGVEHRDRAIVVDQRDPAVGGILARAEVDDAQVVAGAVAHGHVIRHDDEIAFLAVVLAVAHLEEVRGHAELARHADEEEGERQTVGLTRLEHLHRRAGVAAHVVDLELLGSRTGSG